MKVLTVLFLVPIDWKYLICLETERMNGRLLICITLIPNVTIPYLSRMLAWMCVINPLSLGILFIHWTRWIILVQFRHISYDTTNNFSIHSAMSIDHSLVILVVVISSSIHVHGSTSKERSFLMWELETSTHFLETLYECFCQLRAVPCIVEGDV